MERYTRPSRRQAPSPCGAKARRLVRRAFDGAVHWFIARCEAEAKRRTALFVLGGHQRPTCVRSVYVDVWRARLSRKCVYEEFWKKSLPGDTRAFESACELCVPNRPLENVKYLPSQVTKERIDTCVSRQAATGRWRALAWTDARSHATRPLRRRARARANTSVSFESKYALALSLSLSARMNRCERARRFGGDAREAQPARRVPVRAARPAPLHALRGRV